MTLEEATIKALEGKLEDVKNHNYIIIDIGNGIIYEEYADIKKAIAETEDAYGEVESETPYLAELYYPQLLDWLYELENILEKNDPNLLNQQQNLDLMNQEDDLTYFISEEEWNDFVETSDELEEEDPNGYYSDEDEDEDYEDED